MKNITILIFLFSVFLGHISAKEPSFYKPNTISSSLVDTSFVYKRGSNGLIIIPPVEWEPFSYFVTFRDTVIYNPSFLPVVYDGKILPPSLDFMSKDTLMDGYKLSLIPESETLKPLLNRIDEIYEKRRNFYLDINNIGNVRYSVDVLKDIPKFDEEKVTKRNKLHELIEAENPIQVSPLEMQKIDQGTKYWRKNGEHELQISQTYISDNWNGGGNKNFALRSYQKFTVNYEKDKLKFDNLLEWKLNFQSTPADTINSLNILEDQIRMVNSLGYKAFDKWSYSANLETKTQIFTSHPINSPDVNVAFMSPFTTNLGLGMSYALDKKFDNNITKKIKFGLQISPFSLKYIWIKNHDVNPNKGGLKADEYSKLEIGSKIDATLAYQINLFMNWDSRFQYYSNYRGTQVELENKYVLKLNRYLSTQFYLNLRFDDQGEKGNNGYLQIYESLLFGLSYKW